MEEAVRRQMQRGGDSGSLGSVSLTRMKCSRSKREYSDKEPVNHHIHVSPPQRKMCNFTCIMMTKLLPTVSENHYAYHKTGVCRYLNA